MKSALMLLQRTFMRGELPMIVGRRLRQQLTRSIWIMTAVFAAVGFAYAQQTESLEQQLQQLKKQYDETARTLEQRIAALEQQIEKQKEKQSAEKPKEGSVSAVELAAEQAQKAVLGKSDQVGAKFQGQLASAPTYDLLREADQKIEKLQQQV